MPRWSLPAWIFFAGVVVLGGLSSWFSAVAVLKGHSLDLWWLTLCLLMPLLARHYIQLPNITARLCPTGILTQLGALRYGAAEGVLLALVEAFFVSRQQSADRTTRTLFNMGAMSFSIFLAGLAGEAALRQGEGILWVLVAAMVVALTYFALNVGLVMGMMVLTAGVEALRHARSALLWSWAPYVVGGGAAGLVTALSELGMASFGAALIGAATLAVTVLALKQYFGALRQRDEALGEVEHLLGELRQTHLASLETLATAIEAKDPMNHGHSVRVEALSSCIATRLGLAGEEKEAVRVAAMLHDVGKLAVPEYLLHPNRKLTDEDRLRLEGHAHLGAAILSRARLDPAVALTIRHHHERFDGAGYPDGLAGEAIPLGARILAVADTWDKLRNPRGGQGLSRVEALAYVRKEAGQSLDPSLIATVMEDGGLLFAAAEDSRMAGLEQPLGDAGGEAMEEFEWQNRESLLVSWLGERLRESVDPSDMMHALAEAMENLVGCQQVMIFVPHLSRAHTLEVGAARGCTVEAAEALAKRDWPARLLRSLGDDAMKELTPGEGDWSGAAARLVLLSMPFSALERGLVVLVHEVDEAYDDNRRRGLGVLIKQSATAIGNARTFRRYQQQSITDALTGLYNARHLRSEALHMIQDCLSRGEEGCVVMMDLNGFKAINDLLGHDAGDALLVEVSRTLVNNVRKEDLVVRRGGDEFVMMAPRISRKAMGERLEKIFAEASAHWPEEWAYARGTSAGIAWFPQDGRSLDALLKLADERMYADKQARKATREAVMKAMGG